MTENGHPDYAFLESIPDLSKDAVLEMLKRRVDSYGVWLRDGAAVYAAGAKAHQADHKVTLSSDLDAPKVFHWRAIQRRALQRALAVLVINTVISLAKTFIDGTYHGRGRARRQLYLEEFVFRFNRRYMGTGVADRLLIACLSSAPHPNAT